MVSLRLPACPVGSVSSLHSGGCGVDYDADGLDGVGREAAELGVFSDRRFVRGDVDAVDFVVGDEGFQPLDLRPEFAQDRAGFLRDLDKLLFAELPGTWDISFDHKLRHEIPPETGQHSIAME